MLGKEKQHQKRYRDAWFSSLSTLFKSTFQSLSGCCCAAPITALFAKQTQTSRTQTSCSHPCTLLHTKKSHFSKACSIHSHITSVQHKLLFSLQNRHKLHKFSASQRVLGVCRLGKKPLSCHSGTVWCWVFSHFALKQWSQKWTLGKAQGHLYGTEAWKVPGCSALLRAEPISDIRAAEGQTSLLKSHQKPRMTLSSSIARDMGIPTIIWKISSTYSSLLQR